MKLLVLLFLLTSWSLLGSEARSCDTAIAMSSHILNIHGSEQAKASISFLHAYNSSSLENCLEDCCSGIYGVCSVATYKNRSELVNCLHFFCEPLKQCKFLPTTFGDSFAFPGVMKRVESSSSHERSISPRKGVENVFVSRKGVSPGISYFFENLSMKNDNTTSKARKGVDLATMSNLSVIPLEEFEDANESLSRIKARKGVEFTTVPLPVSSTLISQPTSTLQTIFSSSSAYNDDSSHSLTDDELISDLTKIFQDELDANISITKTSYNSTLQPMEYPPLNHTSPVESSIGSTPMLETSFNSISAPSSLSVPQTQSYYQSSSLITFRPTTVIKDLPSSNAQPSQVVPTATLKKSSVRIETTYNGSMSGEAGQETTTSHEDDSLKYVIIEHIDLNNISSGPPSESHHHHLKSAEEIDRERRYKSSMHLVMSLIVGLLVLCTVMGVIAKRVYDLWLRRHYHRMDFLIDGLYDGYS